MMSTRGTRASPVPPRSIPRATLSVRLRRAFTGASRSTSGPRRRRGGITYARAGLTLRPHHECTGKAVYEEREHEQHQAGRDEGGPVDGGGRRLAELVGDHGGQRVALGEQAVADLGRV